MGKHIMYILPVLALLSVGGGVPAAAAGPKSAGAGFAFTGISINWQQNASRSTFHNISLEMDLYRVLSGESRTPGVRFSYVKDFIFASSEHENFTLNWYAGPGFTAGYVMDRGSEGYGLMAGLCADIGAEFNFDIPVCISIGLTPSIAAHVAREEGNTAMDMYTNGLLHIISPKLGIRYRF